MSMSINDLQKDTLFLLDGTPFRVLSASHKKMARQGATVEVKCRNLINKNIITRTFSPSDKFEEPTILKKEMLFLFESRGNYCFVNPHDKSERVMLKEEEIKDSYKYLTPNLGVILEYFNGSVIDASLPIKVDMKVIESPPNIKGNTAQSGTKTVVVETGVSIKTPMFINKGDVIRINTQKGEYAERVQKNE